MSAMNPSIAGSGDKTNSVGSVIDDVNKLISSLNRADALLVVKSVCAIYGGAFRFLPPVAMQPPPSSRKKGSGRGKPSGPSGRADPEIKLLSLKLKRINAEVAVKSVLPGGERVTLPSDDPLIVQKNDCFRLLKEKKAKKPSLALPKAPQEEN
jgi:hypothetical protein